MARPNMHDAHSMFRCRLAALPVELQVQILTLLSFHDILSLCRTARFFQHVITLNQSQIVREQTAKEIAPWMLDLYPPPPPSRVHLHYLAGLRHRLAICSRLSSRVADYITREIFRRTSAKSRARFQKQHDGMQRKMVPLLSALFHYFESFRAAYVNEIQRDGPNIKVPGNPGGNSFEEVILCGYDGRVLLQAVQMYKLLYTAFGRRLRPPTYAGRLERSLRGWRRPGPSHNDLAKILIIGGIRDVDWLWSIKNYDTRRRALDEWLEALQRPGGDCGREAKPPSVVKGAFRRKRSTALDYGTTSYVLGSEEESPSGLPMPPLSQAEAAMLLSHIPTIGWRWRVNLCAELVLLRQGEIQEISDIKGPGRFINDLIGDDVPIPAQTTAEESSAEDEDEADDGEDQDE